jgi:hypothetical protein
MKLIKRIEIMALGSKLALPQGVIDFSYMYKVKIIFYVLTKARG